MQNLEMLLAGLRAAGEHTRLRILALCARGELSVSELTQILGQSQPRVSRHLKLLVEVGLLERLPEGAQVYFRLTAHDNTEAAQLARALTALLPASDAGLNRDYARLDQVRAMRAAKAQAYFEDVAEDWDSRQAHLPREQIERRLVELVGDEPIYELLDIGTGTGRVLEILSPQVHRGVGIDLSKEMLNVARSNIEGSGFVNIHVRHGDMYRLPVEDNTVDLAVLHMVLHYSDDPESESAQYTSFLALSDEQAGQFKTGGLRNIQSSRPYMHDGRFETLEEVIEFYMSGGHDTPNKNPLIRAFNLNAQEKQDLLNFLLALSDEEFIVDEEYK